MIKYRVVIEMGYRTAWFEFDKAEEATQFATTALVHSVDSNDVKKGAKINIEVVDTNKEEEDE